MRLIQLFIDRVTSWFRVKFLTKPLESPKSKGKLRLEVCIDQASARVAIAEKNVIALIGFKNKYKWIQMKCPCGCGETIALNLMQTHKPQWKLDVKTLSIHPSVHSMTCGAHYWVKNGDIIWTHQ